MICPMRSGGGFGRSCPRWFRFGVAGSSAGDRRGHLPDPDGLSWRDLPPGYGHWKTVYNRHRRWSADGTWETVLDALRAGCDEAEGGDQAVSVDSTVARAHQHAAGARYAHQG